MEMILIIKPHWKSTLFFFKLQRQNPVILAKRLYFINRISMKNILLTLTFLFYLTSIFPQINSEICGKYVSKGRLGIYAELYIFDNHEFIYNTSGSLSTRYSFGKWENKNQDTILLNSIINVKEPQNLIVKEYYQPGQNYISFNFYSLDSVKLYFGSLVLNNDTSFSIENGNIKLGDSFLNKINSFKIIGDICESIQYTIKNSKSNCFEITTTMLNDQIGYLYINNKIAVIKGTRIFYNGEYFTKRRF